LKIRSPFHAAILDGVWKNTIPLSRHSVCLKATISGVHASGVTTWQSLWPKHVVTVSEYPKKKAYLLDCK